MFFFVVAIVCPGTSPAKMVAKLRSKSVHSTVDVLRINNANRIHQDALATSILTSCRPRIVEGTPSGTRTLSKVLGRDPGRAE